MASVLYLLAGPNGSGKTSFALNDEALGKLRFINADIEAQQINPAAPSSAALAAGRATLRNIEKEIAGGRSFALETTLSGRQTLLSLKRSLSAGYVLDLTYLCLNSPQLNLARVAMRVADGGHNVPDADVERRYGRSLDNLTLTLGLANRARILDNSAIDEPRLLLSTDGAKITFFEPEAPDWLCRATKLEGRPYILSNVESHLLQWRRQSR